MARATPCAGTRTPTRPVPPVTPRASAAGAGTSSVSGPGQNFSASRAAGRRQRTEPRRDLIGIGGDERQRAVGARPFTAKHARDRVGAERIGREAVERVGRQRDEAAGPNPLRRFLERVPLRRLGVNEHAAHRLSSPTGRWSRPSEPDLRRPSLDVAT